MPLLAALLGNAFVAIVAWFGAFVGKKLAVGAALATFLIAGWVALQLAMRAFWDAIGYAMPTLILEPLSLVAYLLPDNTALCIQALVLARVGRWLWDVQRQWAMILATI